MECAENQKKLFKLYFSGQVILMFHKLMFHKIALELLRISDKVLLVMKFQTNRENSEKIVEFCF